MSEAKISIRFGGLEIEYAGESEFLANGLLELVKNVSEIKPLLTHSQRTGDASEKPERKRSPNEDSFKDLSTDTIATILRAKSGPELVLAAAAHLTLSQGKDKFTRTEITAEMKAAPGFFNETYRKNLSQSLKSLTSQHKLRFMGGDSYALSNSQKLELEAKLVEES